MYVFVIPCSAPVPAEERHGADCEPIEAAIAADTTSLAGERDGRQLKRGIAVGNFLIRGGCSVVPEATCACIDVGSASLAPCACKPWARLACRLIHASKRIVPRVDRTGNGSATRAEVAADANTAATGGGKPCGIAEAPAGAGDPCGAALGAECAGAAALRQLSRTGACVPARTNSRAPRSRLLHRLVRAAKYPARTGERKVNVDGADSQGQRVAGHNEKVARKRCWKSV